MSDSELKMLKLIGNYVSSGALPMHMPGHKRNSSVAPFLKTLGAEYDITEIEGFDNLHDPNGMILKAMSRAAKLWGSKKAYFLVNGSTCGILSAVTALAGPGDKVLMARNSHMSVYNAIEICGADPVFLLPSLDKKFGIYTSIDPDDIKKALQQHPEIKLIIITSPTYEGVISNIGAITEAAHKKGIPVIVDEAHGAHLGFSDYFGGGAVKAGADIVIQSLHKTLPSLTQTAIAHINGKLVNDTEFRRRLSIFETSSPSYLLLSSVEGCVSLLESERKEVFECWEKNLKLFDEKIKSLNKLQILLHGTDGLHNYETIYAFDRSKILISSHGTNINGAELMEILRLKYKIELEMSFGEFALAMTGAGDTSDSMNRLADALINIDGCIEDAAGKQINKEKTEIPNRVCSISEALRASFAVVELKNAKGRASAEYVWAYPPGVPLIIPGEKIDEGFISLINSYLNSGVKLKSTSGMVSTVIRVID